MLDISTRLYFLARIFLGISCCIFSVPLFAALISVDFPLCLVDSPSYAMKKLSPVHRMPQLWAL